MSFNQHFKRDKADGGANGNKVIVNKTIVCFASLDKTPNIIPAKQLKKFVRRCSEQNVFQLERVSRIMQDVARSWNQFQVVLHWLVQRCMVQTSQFLLKRENGTQCDS